MAKSPDIHLYSDRTTFDRLMVLIATLAKYPGIGSRSDKDSQDQDSLETLQHHMQVVAEALQMQLPLYSVHTLRKDLVTLRNYGILDRNRHDWGYYLGTGAMNQDELQLALNALASQALYQADPRARRVVHRPFDHPDRPADAAADGRPRPVVARLRGAGRGHPLGADLADPRARDGGLGGAWHRDAGLPGSDPGRVRAAGAGRRDRVEYELRSGDSCGGAERAVATARSPRCDEASPEVSCAQLCKGFDGCGFDFGDCMTDCTSNISFFSQELPQCLEPWANLNRCMAALSSEDLCNYSSPPSCVAETAAYEACFQ